MNTTFVTMRTSLRNRIIDLLLIGSLPILLALINSNWLFTPPPLLANGTPRQPDAWFYFSYFKHFFDFVGQYPFNTQYFAERLSWNLPGYAAYHLFPPSVANLVL